MQINNFNNQSYNPNFNAIQVAKVKSNLKNIETNLKIYELSAKDDKCFLKKLPQKIDMKSLMPDLSNQEYARWHEMLEYAVDNAMLSDRKTLLAVKDEKPCGILVFLPGKNKFHLDCICTWPVEYGQKVKLAGTALFNQLFKIFDKSKSGKIKLEAITNGPYDTVAKYKKLGFSECGGQDSKIFMESNAQRIKSTLNNLKNLISDTEIKNSERENLNEILIL